MVQFKFAALASRADVAAINQLTKGLSACRIGAGCTDYSLEAPVPVCGPDSPELNTSFCTAGASGFLVETILPPVGDEIPTAGEWATLTGDIDASCGTPCASPDNNWPGGAGDKDWNKNGIFDGPGTNPQDIVEAREKVKKRATAWYERNINNIYDEIRALGAIISPAGMSIIGAGKLHPKLDKNKKTGKTSFYPPDIIITAPGGTGIFINLDWPIRPGFVIFNPLTGTEELWLNSTIPYEEFAESVMVARHEVGHISDHTPFDHNNPAGGDHANNSGCLMHFSVTQKTEFCRDGLLHLRGWFNLHLVPPPEPMLSETN
ncbi:MAG: hypothetical protein GY862_01600 [Gammaproteobacteria bacterium]|nr:hypothetical protein [Gammaproteobacteria bacterium]